MGLEDGLELFLCRLPSWRAGQREAGKALPSPSPERDASPEVVKHSVKEKDREKDRDRDRTRGRDKDRAHEKDRSKKERDASSSVSVAKRKKHKDRSRSRRRHASRSRSSRPRKKDKKLAEPPRVDKELSGTGFASVGMPAKMLPPPPTYKKSQSAPVPGIGAPVPPVALPSAAQMSAVPDWLADLVGGSSVPQQLARGSRREVMVPQQNVARLIGKGGENITAISNMTGAEIKVNQGTKDMGYSLAVLTGHPDAVDQAERLVRQKLGMSSTSMSTKEIPIQQQHVGVIAYSLPRIRQQSGGCPAEVKGLRVIAGPATPEQLMIFEQLVTATIAEAVVASNLKP